MSDRQARSRSSGRRSVRDRPPTPGALPIGSPVVPGSDRGDAATPAQSATAAANAPLPQVDGPAPPPILPMGHQAAMAYSGTGFNARWGPDGGLPPNQIYGPGRAMYGGAGPYGNNMYYQQQTPMQVHHSGGYSYGYGGAPVMTPQGLVFTQPNTANPYGMGGRPIMTPGNRPPYPFPIVDPHAPSANMTNSTGGVGCEPGYSYFFPPEHTKIHFLRTGSTPPWHMPPGTHIEFTATHVPTNISIAQLMKGFGASNSNPQLNNVWEVLPAGNGKWYKGMQFNGDDKEGCKKTLKEVGWDKTRSGLPGESPVVYLYVTKD